FSLFGNSTTFTIINSPNSVSGTWTTLSNTSVSPLFAPLSASYNSPTGTAKVTLTRVAFDLVPGLTPNEEAVADGLENAYAGVLAGGSAEAKLFYESIFQFNAVQYPAALNMLSDVQAGEVAQRNVLSVKGFDDRIDDR